MYNCDYFKEQSIGGVALLGEEQRPEIRVEKVLDIRQQLGEGRFRIADRLDDVIEKLLGLFGG